jgi:4-amino-4-deoxy-L-arabinose transferase-like glycosyltransferase
MHASGSEPASGRTIGAAFLSRRRAGIIVGALAAAIATAGIATIPFYTRGEPREALVVQAMVRGGGWVLPLRNEADLPRKPPFFHWLAAAAAAALGRVDEPAVRLPSAVASVAAVLLVLVWGSAAGSRATGVRAALVAATTVEGMRAATSARVDMVYAALLTLALVSVDRLLRGAARPAPWRWALYAAVAAGILTKGPVALVLPALTVAVVGLALGDPEVWRRLRPGRGLAAVGTVVGGWFFLALERHGESFVTVVVRENLHHLVATDAGGTGHAHSAGYLAATSLVGLLPWTPLAILIVPALRRRPLDRGVLLAGVWTAVVVGVHLVASAKRAVYVLPAHPAIALLLAAGADAVRRGAAPWVRSVLPWIGRGYAAVVVLLAVAVLVLAAGTHVPPALGSLLRPPDRAGLAVFQSAAADHVALLAVLACAALASLPALLRAARHTDWDRLVTVVALVTAGGTITFNAAIHPAIARSRSLADFMAEVRAVVAPHDALHFLGHPDPGALFYAQRPIRPVTRGELTGRRAGTAAAPGDRAGYLLVWERDWHGIGAAGSPVEPLKVSRVTRSGRGHLLLVALPAISSRTGGS